MSRFRKLALEPLEQRQLLSAVTFDPTKALSIPLNPQGIGGLTGTLVKAGEVDPFKFTATLTGTMVIREISGPGTVFPTALTVYNSSGTPISSLYAPPASPAYIGLVAISATQGSQYYVTAAAQSGCVGPYSVQITPDDGGKTAATATPITLLPASVVSLAGSANQQGKIYYSGNVNFFYFLATVSGTITIKQSAMGSSLFSQLTVYSASGQNLGSGGAPNALTASVTTHVTAGSYYFVQAGAFSNGTGAYILQIGTLADPPPVPPVGHTFATATPILITPDPENWGVVTTITSPSGADYAIGAAGNVDYFSFVAPTTGQMTIRQYADASVGSTLDSHLYVYAANQTLIWQNDDSDGTMNSRIVIPVAAGTTYYAEATGHNASTGAYQLSVAIVATTPDTWCTCANATPIVLGADGSSKVLGAIDFTAASSSGWGDSDVYSIVAPSPARRRGAPRPCRATCKQTFSSTMAASRRPN